MILLMQPIYNVPLEYYSYSFGSHNFRYSVCMCVYSFIYMHAFNIHVHRLLIYANIFNSPHSSHTSNSNSITGAATVQMRKTKIETASHQAGETGTANMYICAEKASKSVGDALCIQFPLRISAPGKHASSQAQTDM